MKGIDIEEFAMKLNILRVKSETLKKDYSQDEISKLMKGYGLPCSVAYFGTYVKHNIIVRSRRGVYQFPEEPVYKGLVETALRSIRKYKLDSMKKLSSKAMLAEEQKQVEYCVQFLKERGYVIFKQL